MAVAAFIRDIENRWPVAAALICFVVAVLSGVIIQLVTVAKLDSERWVAFVVSGGYAKWRWIFVVHLLSFFLGVLSIAIYGLMNL